MTRNVSSGTNADLASPKKTRSRIFRRNFFAGAAVAAFLAGLGTAAAYLRDIGQIRRAVDAGGTRVETQSGTIEYAAAGEGPPVLLIHGAGGGYDQGMFLGQEIFGDDFRVIAPSRFGYLGTPVPVDGSSEAQADAHAALLDHLQVKRAIVMGVSAGAPSAIEMALRHPERVSALVLLVPRAYSPEGNVGVDEKSSSNQVVLQIIQRGADFAFWSMSRVARSAVVGFLGVPPELEAKAAPADRARVTEIIESLQPLSRRLAGVNNDGSVRVGPWALEKITVPTLVISSKDDLFNTLPAARFTAAHIKGAQLVVFESGGHLIIGRGEEVRRVVRDFVARLHAPRERAELKAVGRAH